MAAKEAELKSRTSSEPPPAPPMQVLVVEAVPADALPSRAGPRRRSRR
jgi:hypothetical protein